MSIPIKIKIDYRNSEWLKGIALKNLGIENINQLRDRFEGQSYLNAFLVKSYSELALEKFLQVVIVDKKVKETQKNYSPHIVFNNFSVNLIAFTVGNFPKITKMKFDVGIFACVNLESKTVEFLGFQDYKTILELSDPFLLSPIQSNLYNGVIKDFTNLRGMDELFIIH